MTTNEKQYYIYIRSTKERIPCTEEGFRNYYHDIDLFRQRQQYHKQCVCPQKKWLECDMDCQTCPFRRNEVFSLDKPLETADGEELNLVDTIPDESALISDLIADKDQLGQLLRRLQEIMPEALTVGQMRLKGHTDKEISSLLRLKQNTLFYRLKRAKEILEEEFPEFF